MEKGKTKTQNAHSNMFVKQPLKAKECGFQLASACVSYTYPREESIQYLFLEGELARSLWSFFGALFNVPCIPGLSIYAMLAF